MSIFDVIVIGAGHNGLACAGYLARAGLRVKVLERREVVGGAAITEEFHPGFRNSVYSYGVSLLNPAVIRDLELASHGLEIIERPAGTISLLDGDHLLLPRDAVRARQEIARFSQADAGAIDEFERRITDVALALRALALDRPPELDGGWEQLPALLRTGNRLRGLDRVQRMTAAELATKSLGDYLDMWFESDPLKGVLGLEGVIGNFAEPWQPGTAYVLLHHAFGEVNGKAGAWGHARGGMGAITQAMAAFARSRGAVIETGTGVEQIIVEQGRARGVVTADGRRHEALIVASNLHPKTTLLKLLDPGLLPEDMRRRLRAYRSHSATFRMNVALSELPRFHSLPDTDAAMLSGAIEICPSLDYIRRAWLDAHEYGWARHPIISMWIPSTQDDSLAPRGAHVASLFCQHFMRDLPGDRSWDEAKDEAARLILDEVSRYSPNFREAVVGVQVKSPLDIERDLGMVGGDIFHGALHPDQLFWLRPVAGAAGYRMPVPGVFLCGSGAHPGGGVSGLPGRNSARAILGLLGRRG